MSIKRSEFYSRAGGRRKQGDEKPEPWALSFDKAYAIWSIRSADRPIALIHCAYDGWNHERRVAAHLMVNAERLHDYVKSKADSGDADARALLADIERGLAGKDDEFETIDDYNEQFPLKR
jgi:hypothetical protein